MTISFAGFTATVVISAVSQTILKDKGRHDLAETLHNVTVISAASYVGYFVYKLIQTSIVLFL